MSHVIKYFVSGHTAKGYVNFLPSNLVGVKKKIILKHSSRKVLTMVMNQLIGWGNDKKQLEIISHTLGKNDIAGVIVRELQLAILDESGVNEPMDDAVYIDLQKIIPVSESVQSVNNDQIFQRAYSHFEAGLAMHDELENVYINEMDFAKADTITDDFIERLLKNTTERKRQIHVYERLFGTNTPDGMVNYVESLIESFANVFYIKGRAGTGKSVFMKKVMNACKEHGYDIELYHCSFDPKSLDMVIVRELDFCIFDSTPPHEFFPKRDQDEIIDLYKLAVTPGTDDMYHETIEQLTRSYKSEMQMGLHELAKLRDDDIPVISQSNLKKAMKEILTVIDENNKN